MRQQTKTNRMLGINAGRERRSTAADRDEASAARRAEVFRQDVPHAEKDVTRDNSTMTRRREAILDQHEARVLELRAQGASYDEMQADTGISKQYIGYIMRRHGLIGAPRVPRPRDWTRREES